MLTLQLRPYTWKDMAGQQLNIQILRSIVKNPEASPKSLIFQGSFGCGKTTSARILARELNGVTDPNFDIGNSQFYYEYDSTVIGNVEEIRKLRDTFGISSGDYWKVVVLDECHTVSNAAQTALLKTIEEVRGKIFFIFCTTHVNKVLPTIRSRSMELRFTTVSSEDVKENLENVEKRLNVTIPDDIKDIIASRSGGHMRNAHMLVDKYLLIGEQSFKASVISSTKLLCDYFTAIRQASTDGILKNINQLMSIPLEDIAKDFADFIVMGMKALAKLPVNNQDVINLVNLYGVDFLKIYRMYLGPDCKDMFDSDYAFQAGMLAMYLVLSMENNSTPNVAPATTMANKAMIRR